MAEVDIAEQQRMLTDPALSFETPMPTPEDQLREAAVAGLTSASAKEVWEQTRALIMTEDFDAVSREDLLEKLGPEPDDGDILIDDNGSEISPDDGLWNSPVIVETGEWQVSDLGKEARIVVAKDQDGYIAGIQDKGDKSIDWSGQGFRDETIDDARMNAQMDLADRHLTDREINEAHNMRMSDDDGYAL